MTRIKCAILSVALVAFSALAEHDTELTALMIDQNGNLNVDGVASVQDVATNAVKVQIAQAAADAASSTAQGVTNALNGIVSNIMSNNVVIYRYGYTDSFSGMVVFGPDDKVYISDFRVVSDDGSTVLAKIGYVCTADIGMTKPSILQKDSLSTTNDFSQLDDSCVTTPVKHNESRTISGTTFTCWYEIDVSINYVGTHVSHFYNVKIDADTPSGDGTTLELPNGVTNGKTGDYTWGDKVLSFYGGMLIGVRNAE